MHILVTLKVAFSAWMLYDASQRRAPCHWFYIILMPFGACIYFFAVKIHDPEFRTIRKNLLKKKTSIKELRYRAKSSPSIHNRTLLAQALYDQKEYQEAASLFREITKADQDNKAALYGLGLSLINLSDTKAALEALEKLVTLDRSFDDYSPCADLAQTYWTDGQKESAITLLEKVSRETQRLCHKTELARYLSQAERQQDARVLLEDALLDYQNSPRYVRRSNKKWAKQAKSILRSL